MLQSFIRSQLCRVLLLPTLLLLVSLFGLYLSAARDDAMRANFDKVQVGMTYDEVESIFGRRPGRRWAIERRHWDIADQEGYLEWHWCGWHGPGSLTVEIVFDGQNIVLEKRIYKMDKPNEWAVIREWLRGWLERVGVRSPIPVRVFL